MYPGLHCKQDNGSLAQREVETSGGDLQVHKLRTIIYTCVWIACPDMLLGHDISNLFRHILQDVSG